MIAPGAFQELVDNYFDLRNRLAQLERDMQRSFKPGRVHAVDPDKGVRLDFGPDENGEPKLSAWLPHPEQGGEATSWVPPTVGQSLLMVTPPGSDTRKAFLVRAGYCDEFTAPVRKLDENVFDFGECRLTVRRNEIVVNVGSSKITMTTDKIIIDAEKVVTIGDTRLGLDDESDITKPLPSVETTLGPAKQTYAKVNS